MTIIVNYGVTFGKGDGSDVFEWEIDLTDDQAAAYQKSLMIGANPEDVPELEAIIDEVYPEIEEQEIDNGIEFGDEYTMECQGVIEVDADELNRLVHSKDAHALEFFNLGSLSDAEIQSWDANNLDELPLIKDFEPGFEPSSPFDGGYCLNVWIPEFECPDDEEIEAYLREAFKNGNLQLVEEVVQGQDENYFNDISDLALAIAEEVGCQEYIDSHQSEE